MLIVTKLPYRAAVMRTLRFGPVNPRPGLFAFLPCFVEDYVVLEGSELHSVVVVFWSRGPSTPVWRRLSNSTCSKKQGKRIAEV